MCNIQRLHRYYLPLSKAQIVARLLRAYIGSVPEELCNCAPMLSWYEWPYADEIQTS